MELGFECSLKAPRKSLVKPSRPLASRAKRSSLRPNFRELDTPQVNLSSLQKLSLKFCSLRRWNHQDRVAESFQKSLEALGTGYIDLVSFTDYLDIHQLLEFLRIVPDPLAASRFLRRYPFSNYFYPQE